MGHDARGEAEVAEDDVLDAFVVEGLSWPMKPDRLLADEVEDHREVVDAERPQSAFSSFDLARGSAGCRRCRGCRRARRRRSAP